jgi:hypothetical protein
MKERSNGKGKLAEASEEDQGPRRAVEPMLMMTMMMMIGYMDGRKYCHRPRDKVEKRQGIVINESEKQLVDPLFSRELNI